MKHAYLLYTGYGKTKLCLDKIIASPRTPKTLLISTRKIVETSWIAEINKWYPGRISYGFITGNISPDERIKVIASNPDILALNTEMLDWYISHTLPIKRKVYNRSGEVTYKYKTELLPQRFDLLIIDEVSLFKNSQSERFKLIKSWAHAIPNVMVLSATPTPKNIEDLWSTIYLLDAGQRLGTSLTKFRTQYANAEPLPNGYNKYTYPIESIDEILRVVKDIVTSIPAPATPIYPTPIIKKVIIQPDPNTLKIIQSLRRDFITELSKGVNLVAFSTNQMMLKVNQIASGNVYWDDQTFKLNSIKLQYLQTRLANMTTPVLISYVFKFDREKLLQLPGARALETPEDFRAWNNNEIKIGVINPFSTAHGLNLQDSECRNIIWFSPIWDTEKWTQLNARVCRRGQRYVISIEVLLLKDSYDEYVFERCQTKFAEQYASMKKLQQEGS